MIATRPGTSQSKSTGPQSSIELRGRVDHPRVDEDGAAGGRDRPADHRPPLTVDGDVAEMDLRDLVQSTSRRLEVRAARGAPREDVLDGEVRDAAYAHPAMQSTM